MDNINSKCNNVTKEYKEKYDRLLSLVNGYEIANNNQNENMKSLADIINNTKELISESEFENLKKEQKNIMNDFAKFEEMKDDPYSEESIKFSNNIKKPQRFIEEEVVEEEQEKQEKKNKKPQRFIEEEVVEEEQEKQEKKNNLTDKIKNTFSLQNINEIKINKTNNNKKIKESINKDTEEIPRYNNIIPYKQNQQIIPNYYNDGNKKYDVFSNFVPNQNQQMPTIQIVNVQEAQKPKLTQIKKKKKITLI